MNKDGNICRQKTKDFRVNFEFSNDHKTIKINLNIDSNKHTLNINTKNESAAYFSNFLESIWCFKDWDSLCYISSTDM